MRTRSARSSVLQILRAAPSSPMQLLLVLLVSTFFLWMPQSPPSDWELNTRGFWANMPQTYLVNRDFVWPPWGLILLLPYYLMQAGGARVLSVLVIAWLTRARNWPLSHFFAIALSPYFLLTMAKSNIDILIIVLPTLLWEYSNGRRWAGVMRGFALGLLLLKPQCSSLIVIYLLWNGRREWKMLAQALATAAILIVPISLVGNPPLLVQWLSNLTQPSAQNRFYWTINNLSLTARLGWASGLGLVLLAVALFWLLWRRGRIAWGRDQTLPALFLASMFAMPYTSMQSLAGALAFIPAWGGIWPQWLGIGVLLLNRGSYGDESFVGFGVGVLALLASSLRARAPRTNRFAC